MIISLNCKMSKEQLDSLKGSVQILGEKVLEVEAMARLYAGKAPKENKCDNTPKKGFMFSYQVNKLGYVKTLVGLSDTFECKMTFEFDDSVIEDYMEIFDAILDLTLDTMRPLVTFFKRNNRATERLLEKFAPTGAELVRSDDPVEIEQLRARYEAFTGVTEATDTGSTETSEA